MQIIELFCKSQEYTFESVNEIIGRKYPILKYYGSYTRKNPILIKVYRFYQKLERSKKKLFRFFHLSSCPENRNPPRFFSK